MRKSIYLLLGAGFPAGGFENVIQVFPLPILGGHSCVRRCLHDAADAGHGESEAAGFFYRC